MSRAMGQNSLGRTQLTNSLGKQQLQHSTPRDQVVQLETAANLYATQPDVKKSLRSGNVCHKRRHSLFEKRDL